MLKGILVFQTVLSLMLKDRTLERTGILLTLKDGLLRLGVLDRMQKGIRHMLMGQVLILMDMQLLL
jgi:hypothetical protein